MSIRPFLKDAVFDPHDIQAMSMALDDVCETLGVNGNARAKEVMATRIIELATRGERRANGLRDRVLKEANGNVGGVL
jgi:hypothetical protein